MLSEKVALALSALVLALASTGCGSNGGGGGNEATLPGISGLWMMQEEAQGFRKTGQVKRVCESIQKSKATEIANVRLIEADGSVYLFAPTLVKDSNSKVGRIDKAGTLMISEKFKETFGQFQINVEKQDDKLVFNFRSNKVSAEMQLLYLRSNQDEVARYFEMQKNCTQ